MHVQPVGDTKRAALTRASCLGRTIDHGDEAVRDTLRDLAGYALLLLAECAGEAEEATE